MLWQNPLVRGIYLDCNATLPLLKSVREGLATALTSDTDLLNPSSIHAPGQRAKKIVFECKKHLCEMLGTRDSEEWVFVSGATEALNSVLRSFEGTAVAFSTIDHSAVYETALQIPFVSRKVLAVDIDAQLLRSSIDEVKELASKNETTLLCWQLANNETGVVQDLKILEEIVSHWRAQDAKGAQTLFVLLDAAQAFCKLPESFLRRAFHLADYAVISAHKIGGPMGIGALWMRAGVPYKTYVLGGTQEKRRRGGTHNMLGIYGFKIALEDWRAHGEKYRAHMTSLRDKIFAELSKIDGWVFHGLASAIEGTDRHLCNTLNFHVEGCDDESLLLALDLEKFYLSSGSACNSGSLKPSRVLKAMGYVDDVAVSSLRACVGPETTLAEVELFCERIAHRVSHIRASRQALAVSLPEIKHERTQL